MSIHYGISKHTYDTEKLRLLTYEIPYLALSNTVWSKPTSWNQWYSSSVPMFCKGHRPEAKFRILSHSFDKDNPITILILNFRLEVFFSDGTNVHSSNFLTLDYSTLVKTGTYYTIDKVFKFKDIFPSKSLYGFKIEFSNSLSKLAYGNESVLTVVVDY